MNKFLLVFLLVIALQGCKNNYSYENEELKYELREENFKENSFQYHTLYHYGKSNKTEIKNLNKRI